MRSSTISGLTTTATDARKKSTLLKTTTTRPVTTATGACKAAKTSVKGKRTTRTSIRAGMT
jgi:hypothetical protein